MSLSPANQALFERVALMPRFGSGGREVSMPEVALDNLLDAAREEGRRIGQADVASGLDLDTIATIDPKRVFMRQDGETDAAFRERILAYRGVIPMS